MRHGMLSQERSPCTEKIVLSLDGVPVTLGEAFSLSTDVCLEQENTVSSDSNRRSYSIFTELKRRKKPNLFVPIETMSSTSAESDE